MVSEVTLSISDNLITVTSPNLFNSSRICFRLLIGFIIFRRRQPLAHGNWMRKATQPLQRMDDTLLIIRGSHIAGLPLYCIRRVAHCDADSGGGKHADIILLIANRDHLVRRYI